MRQIKTPSDLKAAVEEAGHSPYFFSRANMKFTGDTMRNYGVRRTTVITDHNFYGEHDQGGHERPAWELYRKRPVKHGLSGSVYFDANTFRRLISRGK